MSRERIDSGSDAPALAAHRRVALQPKPLAMHVSERCRGAALALVAAAGSIDGGGRRNRRRQHDRRLRPAPIPRHAPRPSAARAGGGAHVRRRRSLPDGAAHPRRLRRRTEPGGGAERIGAGLTLASASRRSRCALQPLRPWRPARPVVLRTRSRGPLPMPTRAVCAWLAGGGCTGRPDEEKAANCRPSCTARRSVATGSSSWATACWLRLSPGATTGGASVHHAGPARRGCGRDAGAAVRQPSVGARAGPAVSGRIVDLAGPAAARLLRWRRRLARQHAAAGQWPGARGRAAASRWPTPTSRPRGAADRHPPPLLGDRAAPPQWLVLTPNFGRGNPHTGQRTHAALLHVGASFSPRSPGFAFLGGHENLHQWLPVRFGGDHAPDPTGYWFSEGFTNFYTHRPLASGLWEPGRLRQRG